MLDDRITALTEKIEHAGIPDAEKARLMRTLLEGVIAVTQPVVFRHIPEQARREALADSTPATMESYGKLVEAALEDGTAFAEIQAEIDGFTVHFNQLLATEGIT